MEILARIAVRRPTGTLVVLALITLVLGGGIARLDTDVGYRGFLGPQHPAIRQLDAFVERFGGGLPAAAVWSCQETSLCESVFDPPALRMADSVVRALQALDGVRRIESPATTSVLVPTPDGIAARSLVEDSQLAADRGTLGVRARMDPLWRGQLVSGDGAVGAIVVEHSSSDGRAADRVIRALQHALDPFRERGFRYALAGPVLELVLSEDELRADSLRVIPVMASIILFVFLVLFRSPRIALLALGTASVAPLWAMGLAGWLGWPRNAVMQALPPVILVIGTCHSVHWLARYAKHGSLPPDPRGPEPRSALMAVAREIGQPCFMTSATTAAGFLSFLTSGVQSFSRFGVIAAAGVAAALVASFTLLPVLLLRFRPDSIHLSRGTDAWDIGLVRVVRLTANGRYVVLMGAVLLGGVSWFGLTRLRVDVHPYELVGEQNPVIQWARFVADHLHETDSLEIEVDLPSGSAIESPGVLQGIERISDALSRVEGLGRARSIVDAVRWTNRLVHGDRPGFESIPDSPEANAELFLLLSFEADRILDTWVSLDRRHARISVEAEMESQAHQSAILAEVERLLAAELPKGWKASLNGPLWVRHALVGEIQRTQLWSFAAAGAAVFVLLAGFLGSISWAVMAMIPSVLPVMATLGAMGAADIPLDIGGAMVAAVVLGIAVDDTIYLLASYRTRRRRGRPPAVAIRGAVLQVGRAITTTSLALALGFLALTLSHLQSIAHFGILAGIAIVAAWVADLVLLPALLLSLSREPSAAGDSWPDSESDANAKQGGA